MAQFTEREIKGGWTQGYALDLQTLSSTFIGYGETGRARFETQRSEIGELLYKLKYRRDRSAVDPIAIAAAKLLTKWNPGSELIVPVPPSTRRDVPPVLLVGQGLAKLAEIPCIDCVKTTREPAQQLKNVTDLDERKKLVAGLYTVDASITEGRKILLFDDLYRSGATMNAVTEILLGQGKAASVVALAITCTRSHL